MQVFKKHQKIVLFSMVLAVIIIVSFFIVQNGFKPTSTPIPSPTPTKTPSPSATSMPTPTSTSNSPTPHPVLTPVPSPISAPLYPGEVTQYGGINLSPINAVYQNAIAGTQYIDNVTYRLAVTGLVNKTLQYTYDQVVKNHQTIQKVITLNCVEGWSATILWEGVSVNDLLQEAGVSPQATVIIFHASDGYTTSLPLDYIIQNNIIIAYKMNNVTLTPQIGWPFMVVAQDKYGYKWAKWITQIEASNDISYLGYWESQGYSNDASVIPSIAIP